MRIQSNSVTSKSAKTGPLSGYLNSVETMAPRRRPIYHDENTSSDEMSDSSYQPPLHKRTRIQANNMADEILREGVQGVKKRGRGPSKRPCLNRNAQMARENRQKKKEYIQKIENKLFQLQNENKKLNTVIQQQNIDIKKLNADVLYLKSVLNNKSSITMLLRSMNQNLEKLRRKTQKEALPTNYERDPFSDLEPLDNKLFNNDYKIKLEDGANITNNESYQLLADAYRMNNNISKTGKIAKKTAHPFEFDHNYTCPILSADEDEIIDDSRQEENLNHLPVTPVSLNGKMDPTLDEVDLNDFSNFPSNNIFDDLSQLDEMNTLDFNQDTCTTIDDDFFQGLENNSGICLHVNPNRVSLEFCSSCQMNSANSSLE